MPKVFINNRVDPKWQPIIEAKLHIMLGSMFVNVSRIDVELDRLPDRRNRQETYTFCLVVTDGNGARYEQRNDQPDANLAIEGAIARLRRAITRAKRGRGPGWSQASGQ